MTSHFVRRSATRRRCEAGRVGAGASRAARVSEDAGRAGANRAAHTAGQVFVGAGRVRRGGAARGEGLARSSGGVWAAARRLRSLGRPAWLALRAMVVLTVILGVAYPLAMTGVAQVVFSDQANGSVVHDADGQAVGSRLIGQSFTDASGEPLPQYFQPRPSAAGDGYDASASSGSNLGPDSEELVADIRARREQVGAFNGVTPDEVPPDAVTASGSGLDPDISPEYAAIQVARVAAARGLSVDQVRALVDDHTLAPDLGYIGPHRVNVVILNLALDRL